MTRKLSQQFMLNLQEGMLSPFLKQCKECLTLDLEIRENAVNIYYRGGNLIKIKELNATKYEIYFDKNYLVHNKELVEGLSKIITNEEIVQKWINLIPQLKHEMDLWFTKHPKDEREFQQLLVRENNLNQATDYFICDIEYTDIGARFDAIAFEWESDGCSRRFFKGYKPKLIFIEKKYGDGALKGSASIDKHIRDMESFLSDDSRLQNIKEEMIESFKQKRDLGLIKSLDKNPNHITEVSDEKPDFVFILANHDPDSSKLNQVLSKLKPMKHANLKFAVANFMGYGLYKQNLFSIEEFRKNFSNQIFSKN